MNDKQNCLPVSISIKSIPIQSIKNIWKICFSQINTYMSDKFSKYLTGFRKNHNTQLVLLKMIEN